MASPASRSAPTIWLDVFRLRTASTAPVQVAGGQRQPKLADPDAAGSSMKFPTKTVL